MTNNPTFEPGHTPGSVTDAENNLELKEVEGLSQGQIVRRRFFRHRGALVSMVVLAFIIIFIQKRPQGLFAMKGRSAEA